VWNNTSYKSQLLTTVTLVLVGVSALQVQVLDEGTVTARAVEELIEQTARLFVGTGAGEGIPIGLESEGPVSYRANAPFEVRAVADESGALVHDEAA